MTKEQLKKIAIYASSKMIDVYYPLLASIMPKYAIIGKMREAAFIAQVLHESGSFRYTKELASGAAYDTGRKAIALGNTPEADGDGQFYKGRGLIQITGRSNYNSCASALELDLMHHPELLEQPAYAVESACWWWRSHGLNTLADMKSFTQITRVINGGTNGQQERMKFYNLALSVL